MNIHVYAEQQYSNGLWRTGCYKSFPNSPSMHWVLFQSLASSINTVTGRRGMPNDASDAVRTFPSSATDRYAIPGRATKRKYSHMSITELKRLAAELILEQASDMMYQNRSNVSKLLSMFDPSVPPHEHYNADREPLFPNTGNIFRRLVYYFI